MQFHVQRYSQCLRRMPLEEAVDHIFKDIQDHIDELHVRDTFAVHVRRTRRLVRGSVRTLPSHREPHQGGPDHVQRVAQGHETDLTSTSKRIG
jgi:hypothetical protein